MFDWAINTPLHMDKLFNNISFCCNTEQLQNGRYDTFLHTFASGEKPFASAGKYVYI